jgi:diguanylate cyclase (GGDEF)-like protein
MFDPSDIQNLLRFREHAISAISKAKILDLLQEEKLKTEKALKHARQTNKKLEKARQELEEMSFTDPLTKLHNRRFLTTFIQSELSKTIRFYRQRATSKPPPVEKGAIGFVMLDIDHFKDVNDTFGHDSGDLVLKQVAHILKKSCRESDIIIRWGGEEFLIVCLNINAEEVKFLSDRIKTAIEKQVFVVANEKNLNQTCSIGFTCYPFIPSDIKALNYEQMIAIADKCLYVAKTSGRNAWVGVSGTKRTSRKDIPSILNSQFNRLITKGLLEICTSLPDVNSLSIFQG